MAARFVRGVAPLFRPASLASPHCFQIPVETHGARTALLSTGWVIRVIPGAWGLHAPEGSATGSEACQSNGLRREALATPCLLLRCICLVAQTASTKRNLGQPQESTGLELHVPMLSPLGCQLHPKDMSGIPVLGQIARVSGGSPGCEGIGRGMRTIFPSALSWRVGSFVCQRPFWLPTRPGLMRCGLPRAAGHRRALALARVARPDATVLTR